MSGLTNSRISISSKCGGMWFFFFIMNNHVPGALWIRGKLINLCLTMLIRMVFRPMSSKHSWGHDLLRSSGWHKKLSGHIPLWAEILTKNLHIVKFKGNYYYYYYYYFADRKYWFSACTLWKVTGFPIETSSLEILHVDGNLRAWQACGKTEPLSQKSNVTESQITVLQTVWFIGTKAWFTWGDNFPEGKIANKFQCQEDFSMTYRRKIL